MRESINGNDVKLIVGKYLWASTTEDKEFVDDTVKLLTEGDYSGKLKFNIYRYTVSSGLRAYCDIEQDFIESVYPLSPGMLMDEIIKKQTEVIESGNNENNIFILNDFDPYLVDPTMIRSFKDFFEKNRVTSIIVTSISGNIPVDLQNHFEPIDYSLPNEDDIRILLESAIEDLNRSHNSKISTELTDEEKENVISSLKGLSENEIKRNILYSVFEHKKIDAEFLSNKKSELIQSSGVLDYELPENSMEDIGGNDEFKNWFNEVRHTMSDEAIEFGCENVKGYLALGVPGTCKTASAEAIAGELNVPFVKLDMSKIMSSLVGSSEKNIDTAIKTIEALSPCVLLIDEVEKNLSGVGGGQVSGDSGTSARVFAKVLDFLNRNEKVFVVMTANDVSTLPPELTRSGRIDTIWYFNIPNEEERKSIFKIYFDKKEIEYSDALIEYAASITDNYTGAEIKNIVLNIVKKMFIDNNMDKTLNKEYIESAAEEVINVYETYKERIVFLERWCKGRARMSSRPIKEKKETKGPDKNKVVLDFLNK